MALSILVPGNITIDLVNPQKTYCVGIPIHYVISFEGLALKDTSTYNLGQTHLGIEIRGTGPNGGPRGYIAAANPIDSVLTNTDPVKSNYTLTPMNLGYSYFFRANLWFDGQVVML